MSAAVCFAPLVIDVVEHAVTNGYFGRHTRAVRRDVDSLAVGCCEFNVFNEPAADIVNVNKSDIFIRSDNRLAESFRISVSSECDRVFNASATLSGECAVKNRACLEQNFVALGINLRRSLFKCFPCRGNALAAVRVVAVYAVNIVCCSVTCRKSGRTHGNKHNDAKNDCNNFFHKILLTNG